MEESLYHRKFEDWFTLNSEYEYLKNKLYEELKIKNNFNDFKFSNFNFKD